MSAPKCSNFAPPGNRPRHTPQPNQCDLNDTTSTQRRFVFNQLWSGHCLLSRPYGCTSRTDSNCAIDCTMSDRTSPTTVKASLKEQPHPSFNAECAYGPYELWPTSHHCAYGPYELWPTSHHFLLHPSFRSRLAPSSALDHACDYHESNTHTDP